MSQIAYRPVGGTEGLEVTEAEQIEFARKNNYKAIDMVMPLPNGNPEQCSNIDECSSNAMYWENEKGRHGWCCRVCGRVFQWG